MTFKSYFLNFLLIFLIYGCASTESLISDGQVYKGMSKTSLRNLLLDVYPSEDPFVYGSFSEYNSSKKKEIISGSNKNIFYVFKDVNKPMNCGLILCKSGDGKLVSWHNNLSQARAFLLNDDKDIKQDQPEIKTISTSNNRDHVDILNELIEDLESGKITQSEFNQKKAELLK